MRDAAAAPKRRTRSAWTSASLAPPARSAASSRARRSGATPARAPRARPRDSALRAPRVGVVARRARAWSSRRMRRRSSCTRNASSSSREERLGERRAEVARGAARGATAGDVRGRLRLAAPGRRMQRRSRAGSRGTAPGTPPPRSRPAASRRARIAARMRASMRSGDSSCAALRKYSKNRIAPGVGWKWPCASTSRAPDGVVPRSERGRARPPRARGVRSCRLGGPDRAARRRGVLGPGRGGRRRASFAPEHERPDQRHGHDGGRDETSHGGQESDSRWVVDLGAEARRQRGGLPEGVAEPRRGEANEVGGDASAFRRPNPSRVGLLRA